MILHSQGDAVILELLFNLITIFGQYIFDFGSRVQQQVNSCFRIQDRFWLIMLFASELNGLLMLVRSTDRCTQ